MKKVFLLVMLVAGILFGAEAQNRSINFEQTKVWKQIVKKALSARQIFPEEISVSVHVRENDDIYISSIVIQLEKEMRSHSQEILQIVSEQTGITPEILAVS